MLVSLVTGHQQDQHMLCFGAGSGAMYAMYAMCANYVGFSSRAISCVGGYQGDKQRDYV